MAGITISPKYGVNPCLTVCFYCGEDTGEIALLGRLPGDKEAPHRACIYKRPCDKCTEQMKRGVIFICVKNDASGDNPERTGLMAVVTDEGVKRLGLNPPELEQRILRNRVTFIPEEAWDFIGLPKGETA